MDILNMNGLVFHNVYKAIEGDESDKDYLANVAMAALQSMEHAFFPEARKSNADSEFYREEGNAAYKNGILQKALIYYNKAMAYAPNGSLSLKLAYSNRSAVLFSAKEYSACQKDCIKALEINCPTSAALTEKLEKRISQARSEQKKTNIPVQQDKITFRNYAEKFFKLKSRNSEIPCASDDVDVVIESGIPRVVAKRDIAAGTLVGLEKAFVTWAPDDTNQYFSCHYCRKLGLNLFPCSGCVSAMFCSSHCEDSCLADYHTEECKIAGYINGITPSKRWVVKAVLKLINKCASWDELIALSHEYGYKRMRNSTVNDIYDGENPSSILSFKDDRHFVNGALFNSALGCAYFLIFLKNVPSLLPEGWERKLLATKAVARILMFLTVYTTPTILPLVTNHVEVESIGVHRNGHWGLFPFVGKIKHSCMPNLQVLHMNDSIGLVAVEQIKAGTELTVTHVLHWLDNQLSNTDRKAHLFINQHSICTCFVCTTSPEDRMKPAKLTDTQKRTISDCFTLDSCRVFGIPIETCLGQLYRALTSLQNVRFSTEYAKIYQLLKQVQLYLLDNKVHNNILSKDF